MGHCGLFLHGKEIGQAEWTVEKGKVQVQACCPFEEKYIYRVNIYGKNGETVKLGVMAPRNGCFYVCRAIAEYQAKILVEGDTASLRAEVIRTLPGQEHQEHQSPLPFGIHEMGALPDDFGTNQDPLLRVCAERAQGVHYKQWEQMEYLVFSLQVGRELAFAPFFCLITPLVIDGELYGVLCVDPEGEARRFCPDGGNAKTDSFF